jgi:MoaA/NifB/PqqE/SkfB family radical SAM enzyme
MEPDRQLEIQLGHLCNNRCVFCVSGQRTEQGDAKPADLAPAIAAMRAGRARGVSKLTLLGGEPTLQPDFFAVVREAVALGFDEIVIFTNGVKTARAAFVDELLATGGRFTFRLSFQGATREAHERTTRKLGSFQRLVDTLGHLRDRGQRITVNMCVVATNFASIDAFPALLLPYGVSQLHLDLMRPLDAGVRTEDELRATIPRNSDLVPHLAKMIAGFPDGFDVNVGNLPYCVAPDLARWIHHDGEPTLTVSADGDALSAPWDKYLVKRRDKIKVEACRGCAYDAECSGVFETYARFHGLDELVPLRREPAPARVDFPHDPRLDPRLARAVERLRAAAPIGDLALRDVQPADQGARVSLRCEHATGDGAPLGVTLDLDARGPKIALRYALDRAVATPTDPLKRDVASALAILRGLAP